MKRIRLLDVLTASLCLMLATWTVQATAHDNHDNLPRTAVVSAFPPEMILLKSEISDATTYSENGVEFTVGRLEGQDVVLFLTGISVVNATMTIQLALDNFNIERIIFSGIAGGVNPQLNIGDVVVADRWGQYLEMLYAREVDGGWYTMPFFEYPYNNFGMMFPRSVDVQKEAQSGPETRFWFPVDPILLEQFHKTVDNIVLKRCTRENVCLEQAPKIIVGGSGVSGSAFIDNAEFREYVFETFGASVLDMESAQAAHVAYANNVPFIAVRSLSDLAGGEDGENQIEIFLALAAENAATVVMALLASLPK